MNENYKEILKDDISKIEALATLLQTVAERGDLANLGDENVADVSALIVDKARSLSATLFRIG